MATVHEPSSAGSVTRTPLVAPIARALRIVSGALAGAIVSRIDLALAGRLDELERLLEDVLVVAVDDGRAVRPGRAGRPGPSRSPPDAGSGTGLVRTTMRTSRSDLPAPRQPPLPSRARAMTSRWICWVPS